MVAQAAGLCKAEQACRGVSVAQTGQHQPFVSSESEIVQAKELLVGGSAATMVGAAWSGPLPQHHLRPAIDLRRIHNALERRGSQPRVDKARMQRREQSSPTQREQQPHCPRPMSLHHELFASSRTWCAERGACKQHTADAKNSERQQFGG